MPTLIINIGADGIEIRHGDTLHLRLPMSDVRLEVQSGTKSADDPRPATDSRSRHSTLPSPQITATGTATPPRRRAASRKKLADYAAEMLQQQGKTMTTRELADIITQDTDYQPPSGTLSPNTVRTALLREPDRFVQRDKYTWGLLEWVHETQDPPASG